MDQLLSNDIIEAVVIAIATLLGTLAAGAGALLLVRFAAKWYKDVVAIVRQYEPRVIAAVDEPTDAIPMRIDTLLDRVYPGSWDVYAARALPAFYRALADVLEANEPVREVNIGEGPK